MTAWLGQVPALLIAFALLTLPGLPVSLLVRGVRGIVRLGITVAVSIAIVGAATLVAPVLGLRWGIFPVLMVSVGVWIVAGALRRLDRRPSERPIEAGRRIVWITLAVAVLGWIAVMAVGIATPGHPSQLYDALFHFNAVEYIEQTGDASPLHMTLVVPPGTVTFYPTLWHAFVGFVLPFTGGVIAATNVMTIAVIAVVWSTAVAVLAAVAFPRRPGAAVWAPLAAFGFSVFPLGFLNWGVLYPNLIGTALVPIVIATVVLAFAPGLCWSGRVLRILVAVAAAGGSALGHPSALLGALALLVPYGVWQAWVVGRRRGIVGRILFALLVVAALIGLVAVWFAANVSTHEWLPGQTMAQTLGEVAFLSPVGRTAGLLLGPLAAVGLWRVVKDRTWWILTSYLVGVLLFLAAAWLPILPLRSFLVGVWYDDTTRVAALVAIWGIPLAGLGASVVFDWLTVTWERGLRRRVVAIVALLAVGAASHLPMLLNDARYMRNISFRFDEYSQGLTPDEAELFDAVADKVSADEPIIGDPLTGAGLYFALTGGEVVFPHVTGRYSDDAQFVARELVGGGPEVCAALDRLNIRYAFDFGEEVVYQNHFTTYDGLHGFADSSILTEVDRVGDAVLYEVTGCE